MRSYAPVDFTKVTLSGDFWRERLETVLTRTIPSQYAQARKRGPARVAAACSTRRRRSGSRAAATASPPRSSGTATSASGSRRRATRCATAATPTIEAQIDDIVTKLDKAQLPDGYLNLWYIGREIDNRWTNLRDNHELYNCGHLLEGAIAYFQATGRRRMLDVMERYLDHIRATFGTGPGQKRGYCGHQEIEIALVKLYHLTGEKKQLDLAAYFIDERGRQPHYFDIERDARGEAPGEYGQGTYEYSQSHKPVREQDKVVGHAVRAMYMYTAMADLAAELGDDGAEARLRGAVARRDLDPDVRDRRLRPLGLERGLHLRLRPAERHRLCRDLRLGRDDLLGAADAQPRARRPLRRRARAARSTTARSPGCRATASTTSTRTSSRATAPTGAGTGTPARAAR